MAAVNWPRLQVDNDGPLPPAERTHSSQRPSDADRFRFRFPSVMNIIHCISGLVKSPDNPQRILNGHLKTHNLPHQKSTAVCQVAGHVYCHSIQCRSLISSSRTSTGTRTASAHTKSKPHHRKIILPVLQNLHSSQNRGGTGCSACWPKLTTETSPRLICREALRNCLHSAKT